MNTQSLLLLQLIYITGRTLAEVIQATAGISVSGNEITIYNIKAALDKWAKRR